MRSKHEATPQSTSVKARFEAKVSLLEKWVRDGGAPIGVEVPKGPVALRNWTSADPLLEAWGSPNVVSDKSNKALRDRFDVALAALSSERSDAAASNEKSENCQIVALAEQVDNLLADNQRLQTELAETEHKLELAKAKVAERDAELHKLLRFGPRS